MEWVVEKQMKADFTHFVEALMVSLHWYLV